MKKIISLCFLSFLFFSCKNEKDNAVVTTLESDSIRPIVLDIPQGGDDLGLWSGIFEADSINYENKGNFSYRNRISIVITKINNGEVEGYSVSAGNLRPFTGDIIASKDSKYVMAKEPGDHKYDGVFKFNISENGDSIYGKWISNRKDLPVISRSFNLKKKNFEYNPKNILVQPKYGEGEDEFYDEYDNVDWVNTQKKKIDELDGEEYFYEVQRVATDAIYKINGSTKKLSEKELKNLRKLDLEIIRNSIYARHGYSFANRGARQFFDNVDWYVPLYTNVEDKLTPTEKENIALLKRFEKYATDNYDQFGR